jgi:starch phosphorylase
VKIAHELTAVVPTAEAGETRRRPPRSVDAVSAGRTGDTTDLMACLWALAQNLWWSWQPEVIDLFRDLDPVRWRQVDHNPIPHLLALSGEQVEERARELVLHGRIRDAHRRLTQYLTSRVTWGDTHAGVLLPRPVAYFSAEFGLHESLPIYSGGLGVLAGDHVKSASDLGVPLVAVGLFYSQGYFRQHLDGQGRQREEYVNVAVEQLPMRLAVHADGRPLRVVLATRTGDIAIRIWTLAVGRITVLLLDSNCEGNSSEDRTLTARLYGGDARTRIRQELLLGVGGVRALRALGFTPSVLHLNEGHSAFASLEMARQTMEVEGIGFPDAARRAAEMTCFTTHTPVAAGHDRFEPALVEEHLGPLREAMGLSHQDLIALGKVDEQNPEEAFCMTVLALRFTRRANAVSSIHGHVSRHMWREFWPDRRVDDVPIGHITNGVHVHTWLASQMRQLYDRHMGPAWSARSGDPDVWRLIDQVDDQELWDAHRELKERLLIFARRRAARACRRRGASLTEIGDASRVFDPEVLTIGFARRFATYKRATLLLYDLERLVPLFESESRPIQIVFAGKAHPSDQPGKYLLQQIAELMSRPPFAGRLLFLEDYDINLGRHLVQGVDMWLNNPRRPLEASGTSGQKVVLNGGLNLSVLDGWWAEAYDGSNGFAIGLGEVHVDPAVQDRRDADNLYRVLEERVIPLYYTRDDRGLPRDWIAHMKRSIRTLGWRFNADRMVMDYVRHAYLPAAGGMSRG